MENSLGQYCINVTDLDSSVEFWSEVIGIPVQSRTEIPTAKEVVLQAEVGGSRIQLAQQLDQDGPIDMGTAMWKLYVDTEDCQALYDKAIALGVRVGVAAAAARPLAGDGGVHQGPRRLPHRAAPEPRGRPPVAALVRIGVEHARQRVGQAHEVVFVHVDVRREPQHLAAHRGVAVGGGEAGYDRTADRSGRRTPSMWGPRCSAGIGSSPRPAVISASDVVTSASDARDAVDAPLAELLQRGDRHGHELELAALAHVEAARAGLVLVAVVGQPSEVLRTSTRDPVLLDRRAVAVLLGDVEVRDADRTQQPLVPDVVTKSGCSEAMSNGIAPID